MIISPIQAFKKRDAKLTKSGSTASWPQVLHPAQLLVATTGIVRPAQYL